LKFDSEKTIFLIDGSSFLYRAYYGMRPLHTSKREPVHAVYSFCRMIKKLIDKFEIRYGVLVWDSKGKTTRHEIYEAYKATRDAPPRDLFDQKKHIVEFADLIGLKQVSQTGVEADDLMFSLARERDSGDSVVFITSDKDMKQALDVQTFLYDAFKDRVFTVSDVEEKLGFEVAKVPFYFSLVGDASDNIPGVRGIGKKGATELVSSFKSLQDLYERIDEVTKPRQAKALQAYRDDAFLSEKLFRLHYQETGLLKKDLFFDKQHWNKANPFFERLEFTSLLMQSGAVVVEKKGIAIDSVFKTVTVKKELVDLVAYLSKKKIFAFDTETMGVDPLRDACVGISFCAEEGLAYYVPFGHIGGESQLSKNVVLDALRPLFEDPRYKKYLHNVKFDQLVLHNMGISLNGVVFDSMIAAHLLAREGQRVGLKALSLFYFGEKMLSYADVVTVHKFDNFAHVPLDKAAAYSAHDAHQTFKLCVRLKKELFKEKALRELYEHIEFPLSQVLFRMELAGICLDSTVLKDLDVHVVEDLRNIKKKIIDCVGSGYIDINLNSPKQVEQLLFYDLKLPVQKKSAKGNRYSTDYYVLQKLSGLHPVPELILRYRELAKLKSTYIDVLPLFINQKTGRIHTTFNQVAVATGRLSSSDPNLQNIPASSSGYGIEIRSAFKADKGKVFLSVDYSQIELRVLAHLSGDALLKEAFLSGRDIHAETAAYLFGVNREVVTHEQRQIGKRINFSILYGLTPYGLSRDLGISLQKAKAYIDAYFERYPGVLLWMENVVEQTKELGYVTTAWGRRRFVGGIYEQNKILYREARRIVINTVAQGTAAEIMKIGMIKLDAFLAKSFSQVKILLQIHDELLLSVPEQKVTMVESFVKKTLESVVEWEIPLHVNTQYGHTWKDATK
jgi:DNA polymerase-1